MKIPNTMAPMTVSAVRDTILYQENLMKSETLRDREDYEEYHLQLTQFLAFLKEEYGSIEKETGIPLEKIL